MLIFLNVKTISYKYSNKLELDPLGSETSQYQKENKSNEILHVVASESK